MTHEIHIVCKCCNRVIEVIKDSTCTECEFKEKKIDDEKEKRVS